ncbi:MAG: bifunctional adenosylcobinamide kinase/adenosylcobinamide-phosphate guanylyltransferase [Nostocales cyanobacterium]|nr:MAG: bifunctional adenosylcobinamide kinase/adenosylcobinamide-phosphate guanylyltransferase [Nostocales cyanobacterium]TAF19866.1 MAG: bifunctional adenosylcobinamide kinase/adenosylcobinamide-phosphate guanylyltransferase [Nostocales cyanobacterium]
MNRVILVTGPARSGKSEWAEDLAIQSGKPVIYVATATENPNDQEWQERIEKHKQRRPKDWQTISAPVELSVILNQAKPHTVMLVDSLGTWIANCLEDDDLEWEKTLVDFLTIVPLVEADLIFVAEETGWGVVPAYPIGRKFRDRLGNLVRRLSTVCETVYLVTGGYVLNLNVLGIPLPEVKS